MPEVAAAVAALPAAESARAIDAGDDVEIALDGDRERLAPEDLLLEARPTEGYAVGQDAALAVGLATEITPELRREALAREVVHAVQGARRAAGLRVEERIHLHLDGSGELARRSRSTATRSPAETLATRLTVGHGAPSPGCAARSTSWTPAPPPPPPAPPGDGSRVRSSERRAVGRWTASGAVWLGPGRAARTPRPGVAHRPCGPGAPPPPQVAAREPRHHVGVGAQARSRRARGRGRAARSARAAPRTRRGSSEAQADDLAVAADSVTPSSTPSVAMSAKGWTWPRREVDGGHVLLSRRGRRGGRRRPARAGPA